MMSVFGQQNSPPNNTSGQPGIIQQLVTAVIWSVLIYLTLLFVELIYKYINRLKMNRTVLLPKTYTMGTAMNISQNPNIKGSNPIYLSDNERTGVEFSYSFYLYVDPKTFEKSALGLKHIFHKGYAAQFPLLAPGVYMRSDTNTLRVYMNTYKTWNNFVEVDNFPVKKWVHVTIVCKNSALEIFINGNIARKMSFDGFAPYQNYQDICCFSDRKFHLKHINIPSTDSTGLDVFGVMSGLFSRLNYFNYALCYAEIQQLMNEGPSKDIEDTLLNNVPPYLDDTWWAQGY